MRGSVIDRLLHSVECLVGREAGGGEQCVIGRANLIDGVDVEVFRSLAADISHLEEAVTPYFVLDPEVVLLIVRRGEIRRNVIAGNRCLIDPRERNTVEVVRDRGWHLSGQRKGQPG